MSKSSQAKRAVRCALTCIAAIVFFTAATAFGGVSRKQTAHGDYLLYTPNDPPRDILVLAHGSRGEKTALDVARTYIDRWTEYAEKYDLLVVVPAFDQERFDKAYGGYRGLFGRDIGADEFVLGIVDKHSGTIKGHDGRFLLYGHSAGGQFVCRFVVRHADRVRAAVLCAPGRFAFPTPDAAWPYGMGPFDRTLDWGGGVRNRERVTPDPDGWLDAAELPVAVVVGQRDTDQQPERPGHDARTRVGLARQWVREMRDFATEHERDSRTRLVIARGIGHDSRRLTPVCQRAFEICRCD